MCPGADQFQNTTMYADRQSRVVPQFLFASLWHGEERTTTEIPLQDSWNLTATKGHEMALIKWIKNAVEKVIADPDREQRIGVLAARLYRTLQLRKKDFTFGEALSGIECTQADLELARFRVYQQMLVKAWEDGSVKPGEQRVLKWVADCLELPPDQVKQLDLNAARNRFTVALARAMEDGIIDVAEEASLSSIALSAGSTMAEFARSYFRSEGEGFLRGVFLAYVADGQISAMEWQNLLQTTTKLGISHQEFLTAIHPQARQFVEHVLADAKADGQLSENEDATLGWLLNSLALPADFRQYVIEEASLLRSLTKIQQGKLQPIQVPHGVEIRAGEIVYFHTPAVWRQAKMLKSGLRHTDHHGSVTLTDNRLLFASVTKSNSVSYRKVLSHRGGSNWIEMQIEGKPAETLYLGQHSPIPYALFHTLVAMANQTRVAQSDGASSRHIPRDVRQRVWQSYSGRCAECNAADYLEFDHIIPVAKGGSNADANIQLLCRRCNQKKSDFI